MTLILVLVAIVILGLSAGIAGSTWQDLMQRSREKELLWRGRQYRQAIASFYHARPGGGVQAFPARLEDLARDPRFLETRRHIRRLYLDPLTGGEWVPLKGPADRIIGVRSSSALRPFKQSGFPPEEANLEGCGSYSEWEFVFTPQAFRQSSPQRPSLPGVSGAAQPAAGDAQ